jgi:hypothetical protein
MKTVRVSFTVKFQQHMEMVVPDSFDEKEGNDFYELEKEVNRLFPNYDEESIQINDTTY